VAEFDGSGGKIHYGQWVPSEPHALVVFFHGLGEHIGSYGPFAAALNEAGFALWAADHAGHGRSEGERVLIGSVDHLLDDAETLVGLAREAHPGLPLVLAGSSLVPDPGSGLAALLASGIDPWELRKDPGELTRHPGYARQIREDPLTWQGGLRLETLAALGEAAPRVSTVLGSLDPPVLLLHGAEDDLAPASGAERAAELLPDARAVILPLVAAVFLAAACGTGGTTDTDAATSSQAATPPDDQLNTSATVNVRLVLEPTSLNIFSTSGAALDQILLDNVYEGLVSIDTNAKDRIVARLATSWEQSADGLTYTFHLVPNAKFHDGSPPAGAARRYANRSRRSRSGSTPTGTRGPSTTGHRACRHPARSTRTRTGPKRSAWSLRASAAGRAGNRRSGIPQA